MGKHLSRHDCHDASACICMCVLYSEKHFQVAEVFPGLTQIVQAYAVEYSVLN